MIRCLGGEKTRWEGYNEVGYYKQEVSDKMLDDYIVCLKGE